MLLGIPTYLELGHNVPRDQQQSQYALRNSYNRRKDICENVEDNEEELDDKQFNIV